MIFEPCPNCGSMDKTFGSKKIETLENLYEKGRREVRCLDCKKSYLLIPRKS